MEYSVKMRLRLEYYDQNEKFAKLLPLDGTVERIVFSADKTRWALFHLMSQIEYDGQFFDDLLLRSRWKAKEIDDPEGTSVFICLVDDSLRVTDGFNKDDFPLVAWGMVAMS